MNKKIKMGIKILLTGLVWGLVYFLIVVPSFGVLFDFDFLSSEAWQEKKLTFVNYNWRIRTLPDALLVVMMILWIPIYFVGWFLFVKIKWSVFKIKPKPKTIVRRALDIKKDKPLYAKPRSMPSTVQATKYVAPKLPGQEETPDKKESTKSHKNVLQMIKQMAVVARKFKVEIFQHILLEGHKVPMAVSTSARALMIEIVNRKDVNWSVDFNDDVLASNWYSEGGVMERLAEDLIKASDALAKAEPGSEVIKAICLTDGRILNAKPTVEYFKNYGIHLLVFNNGMPKNEILDFASFLSAHFELKEGETDPALVKLPKVPLKSNTEPLLPPEEENQPVEAVESETTSLKEGDEADDRDDYPIELDEDIEPTLDDDEFLTDDDIFVPEIDEDGYAVETDDEEEEDDQNQSEQGSDAGVQNVSKSRQQPAQKSQKKRKNLPEATQEESPSIPAEQDDETDADEADAEDAFDEADDETLPEQTVAVEDGEDDFITVVARG